MPGTPEEKGTFPCPSCFEDEEEQTGYDSETRPDALALRYPSFARPINPVPRRIRLPGSGVGVAPTSIPNVEEPTPETPRPKLLLASVLSRLKFAGVSAYPGNKILPIPLIFKLVPLSSVTHILVMVNVAISPPEPAVKVNPPGELNRRTPGAVAIVVNGVKMEKLPETSSTFPVVFPNVIPDVGAPVKVHVSFPKPRPIVPLSCGSVGNKGVTATFLIGSGSANTLGVIARAVAITSRAIIIFFIVFLRPLSLGPWQ
jgi:hypothetical protein